jgi:hypothetical protein
MGSPARSLRPVVPRTIGAGPQTSSTAATYCAGRRVSATSRLTDASLYLSSLMTLTPCAFELPQPASATARQIMATPAPRLLTHSVYACVAHRKGASDALFHSRRASAAVFPTQVTKPSARSSALPAFTSLTKSRAYGEPLRGRSILSRCLRASSAARTSAISTLTLGKLGSLCSSASSFTVAGNTSLRSSWPKPPRLI